MGESLRDAIDCESVLEAMPQPIAVCNLEGDVLFLNAMGRHFLGVRKEDDYPRFGLNRRDTFSRVRIEMNGPIKEYFLADVVIEGSFKRERASMSVSLLGADRYRVILEDAPAAWVTPILDEIDALVAICDQRREVRLANGSFTRLLSERSDAYDGGDMLAIFDDSTRDQVRLAASEALAGGRPSEFMARLSGGLPKGMDMVRVRLRPIHEQDSLAGMGKQRGFVLVVQPAGASFSELERRLERAEELMSIGELATGIAHELKNPLTSMLNYADYLMGKYKEQLFEARDRERLQRIIDGVQRIDQFVRDLLLLARPDAMEKERVELRRLLKGIVALNQRVLEKHQVEVFFGFDDETVEIWANGAALHQVFTNLLLNAAVAMPAEGGRVSFLVEERSEELVILVEDTACGIDEKILGRIFEPFFSTRHGAGGTGLGLALVRRIIKEHRGRIDVRSTPGEGTCFEITLPRNAASS